MLAFARGEPADVTGVADALRRAEGSDAAAAERLIRRLAPGWQIEPAAGEALAEATYPAAYPNTDTVYALSVPGLDLVCGLHFLPGRGGGARLPEHVLAEGAGRRVIYHWMHSGSDSVEIAVWTDGTLTRAIGIDGASGIVEDVGEPLPFEASFPPSEVHPSTFGNEAARALFGFALEGRRAPDDVDPTTVHLHGFHVTDPDGPSLAERQAAMLRAASRMKRISYRR